MRVCARSGSRGKHTSRLQPSPDPANGSSVSPQGAKRRSGDGWLCSPRRHTRRRPAVRPAPRRAPRPRGPARPTSHTRALDRWPTPCAVCVLLRQSFSYRDAVLYSTTACKSFLLSVSLHRGAKVQGVVEGARAHRRSFLTERMTGREWRSNPFYPPAFAWANEGPPVLRVSIRAPHREETKRKINFIHEDMPKRRTGRRRDDDATTTGTARPRWLRPQAAYKLEAAGEIQVLCARERRGGTCASCGAEHTLGLLTISYLSLLVALARGAESTKLRQSILSPPPPSS